MQLSKPVIGDDEKQAVLSVLDSGIVAQGPKVRELENAFAQYCGTEHAVALNSGTAAIHTALHAAEIGPGDSVITAPFTFIATANPILMQGGNIKFADIEPDTFNIDAQLLEGAYDPSVKAILPVDLYGQPCDYDAISNFAEQYELTVIEDACQSVGAEYKGRKTGSLGRIACFSLYATKNIMSAEGGVITTDSEEVAKDARSFRQHGMDMDGKYDYIQLGYNYRTTDILAAVALAQLAKTDRFNEARAANACRLAAGIRRIPGLVVPIVKPDRLSAFHQFTIRITEDFSVSREEFISRMSAKGITTAIYYPRPLHLYPHMARLGYNKGDFPIAEQAAKEVVSLPVHPTLTDSEIEYMIETIKDIAYA
ncbi:hypothetical protein A2886_03045 [candidate division WWE3 bacterium RIFCSPHIGHO2_01_FULL_42_13]|uniref:Aminotransferase DegT n=1 Tax=candidate division WWE3 bacterium RIFCSPHIGHO2_01_FULL_42_13 TaxID=1802617 RepID=A0A1F4UQ54_UNCKA|nr:MAG: hypothetical protein A2886_03045 [candidate division WWE3 bacterium RIFCSPHIGHO2_01_FULL_42_13]